MKMTDPPPDAIDMRLLLHDPPCLPPMDYGTEGTSMVDVQDNAPVEHTINRRVKRMKFKNCGVLATKNFFIKDDEVDKHSDDLLPPLTALEGTITAVPNMQKKLLNYEIHWETNASLPISFNINSDLMFLRR